MESNVISDAEKTPSGKLGAFFNTKKGKILAIIFIAVFGGLVGRFAFADTMTTATPNGIWKSIPEIKALPMSGPAWQNVKSVADRPLGGGILGDQDTNHDIQTYAVALAYARTGDANYRKKAADAVMSVVGTELKGSDSQDNRALALGWNLTSYVVAADLINLPQYDAAKNKTFSDWLRVLRTKQTEDKSIVECHEQRPNNWGTGCGAARVAASVYLGDKADVARAANVFKGWLGDRNAYSGFSYGDLSWQCDGSKPVGINPVGCSKQGVSIDGAIPDDMRRGASFRVQPEPTHYPWTALNGAMPQAFMLARQGYDTFGWSNQALKRSLQYLYNLSRNVNGSWWHDGSAAHAVPWMVNAAYGSNFPTANNSDVGGRVINYTDWTHAQRTSTPPPPPSGDSQAPTTPTNFKASIAISNNVSLTWAPSTDNVAVAGYEISRNGSILGTSTGTNYKDTSTLAPGGYIYEVKAYDQAGNKSQVAKVGVTIKSGTADPQAPTVRMIKPANGAVVTLASTALEAEAKDNVGIAKVEFYVNWQLEATVQGAAGKTQYTAAWDTRTWGNGKYLVEAKAYDTAGNVANSTRSEVTVKLSSVPTTPPPPPSTGGTLSIKASADARVSAARPNKNYGLENFLRVRSAGKDSWTTFLRFNVEGLSGTPRKVVLRMYANDGGPNTGRVYRVADFNERTITWNNKPIIGPGYTVINPRTNSVNDRSWTEFDITGNVLANGMHAFAIQGLDDNSVYFDSREGTNKPTLVITK